MKKGVQLYTVRDFISDRAMVAESLRKIKEIGYEAIQASTPPFMTDAEMKQQMDDAGLGTFSANADFEMLENDANALKAAVEQAHAYGVDFVAVGTLPEPLRESRDGYMRFAERANRVVEMLGKENLKLLYHPHALECFSLGGGLNGLDIMVDETDPDGFWFCLDTHWLASGGLDVCDWIRRVRGRMDLIHFKDYAIVGCTDKVESVCRQFAEVGEGNLNWVKIIEACKQNGVNNLAVEQDICRGDPFDSLGISYRNLIKYGA